jgi:hypothetical protein
MSNIFIVQNAKNSYKSSLRLDIVSLGTDCGFKISPLSCPHASAGRRLPVPLASLPPSITDCAILTLEPFPSSHRVASEDERFGPGRPQPDARPAPHASGGARQGGRGCADREARRARGSHQFRRWREVWRGRCGMAPRAIWNLCYSPFRFVALCCVADVQ